VAPAWVLTVTPRRGGGGGLPAAHAFRALANPVPTDALFAVAVAGRLPRLALAATSAVFATAAMAGRRAAPHPPKASCADTQRRSRGWSVDTPSPRVMA